VACEMIRAVKEGGAQIVNLSLGGHTLDNMPPVALRAALEIITEWEHQTGREVLIVAAAGNYADTTPCWPAAFRRVVSVASLAPDMLPSQWSSHGFWVTCSTIGQGLSSTFVEGRESNLVNPEPHNFGPDSWAVWSGTSFTAPRSQVLSRCSTKDTDTRSARRSGGCWRLAGLHRTSAKRCVSSRLFETAGTTRRRHAKKFIAPVYQMADPLLRTK